MSLRPVLMHSRIITACIRSETAFFTSRKKKSSRNKHLGKKNPNIIFTSCSHFSAVFTGGKKAIMFPVSSVPSSICFPLSLEHKQGWQVPGQGKANQPNAQDSVLGSSWFLLTPLQEMTSSSLFPPPNLIIVGGFFCLFFGFVFLKSKLSNLGHGYLSWPFSNAMFWKLSQPLYLPSGSSLLTCKFCHGPNNLNGCSQPLHSALQKGSLACSGLEKKRGKWNKSCFPQELMQLLSTSGFFFSVHRFFFSSQFFLTKETVKQWIFRIY